MAKRHVLMVGFEDLVSQVEILLPKISGQLDLISVPDGARCVSAHTKLAAAGVPPLVVILRPGLEFIDGPQTALTLRALERSLGVGASAVLYVTDEGASEGAADLVASIGRAVNLKWNTEQSDEQAAQRLVRAMAKILEQLRKRGKS